MAGAKTSAVIYSLMLTCRARGVEPYAYLRHVLTELPRCANGTDVADLLPFNYAIEVKSQANYSLAVKVRRNSRLRENQSRSPEKHPACFR